MLGGVSPVKAKISTLQSRRAMLNTLMRHLGMIRLSAGAAVAITLVGCTGLISGNGDPNLTPEQVARLDAASKPIPAYPYWHQRGNPYGRNPDPV